MAQLQKNAERMLEEELRRESEEVKNGVRSQPNFLNALSALPESLKPRDVAMYHLGECPETGERMFYELESLEDRAYRNIVWGALVSTLKEVPERQWSHVPIGDVCKLFDTIYKLYGHTNRAEYTKSLVSKLKVLRKDAHTSFDAFRNEFTSLLNEMSDVSLEYDESLLMNDLNEAMIRSNDEKMLDIFLKLKLDNPDADPEILLESMKDPMRFLESQRKEKREALKSTRGEENESEMSERKRKKKERKRKKKEERERESCMLPGLRPHLKKGSPRVPPLCVCSIRMATATRDRIAGSNTGSWHRRRFRSYGPR